MKMIVGGQKIGSKDGSVIEVLNPATQELIDTVPCATKEDIEAAIQIAQIGKKKWAETHLHERAKILMKFAGLLEEHLEELAILQCKEMGKIIRECKGELSVAAKLFRGFVERATHMYGEVIRWTPMARQIF